MGLMGNANSITREHHIWTFKQMWLAGKLPFRKNKLQLLYMGDLRVCQI